MSTSKFPDIPAKRSTVSTLRYEKAGIDTINLVYELDKAIFYKDHHYVVKDKKEIVNFCKTSDVYIIYLENMPIGYYGTKFEKNKTEITGIGILDTYQGKGIGSVVMEHIGKKLSGKIVVQTHPHNNKSLGLYLKQGFTIMGWKDNALGDGKPRIYLEKTV